MQIITQEGHWFFWKWCWKNNGELSMKSSIRDALRKISPLKNYFWRYARPLQIYLKIFQGYEICHQWNNPWRGFIFSGRQDQMLKKPVKENEDSKHPANKKTKTRIRLSIIQLWVNNLKTNMINQIIGLELILNGCV